ncbi:3-(3-hydroxy-phenyl)propionate/3-hydroxycinnamic acid hydroxylase [compost metagenome]
MTLLNRTRFERFTQDADGVSAIATDMDSGATRSIRCRYMVGCDGGSSPVRKQIGAKLEGTAVIQRVQSTFIRAPQLRALIPGKPAWSYYAMNPRRCGTMFAIDGHETWLVHNHLNAEEPEFDSVDRDTSIREILGVGPDFHYDIISKEDWIGRRLVATRFREGRVFLAGDAAHLWVPYAGYGMNAGIADALNLSWLLGACVQGWGDEAILDAYEAERLPITEQVSQFAMDHAQKMIRARRAVPPDIEAPGPAGDAQRAEIGREAYALNVQQFCCGGLNFGYFYTGSPIIVPDGEHRAPPYSMGEFTPSTVPGCRAPHFWLADGRSLYDAFGPGYTLLRFDRSVDVRPLERAAAAYRMPLTVLDIETASLPKAYAHRLVMCRADQHIAWRGAHLPADVYDLVATLRGETRRERGRRRALAWEGVLAERRATARHASHAAMAGASAKTVNNQIAAERAPSTPPGTVSPAAFATSPATAAPTAMPYSCTVVIDADAKPSSPRGASAITRVSRCGQPMPTPKPTAASATATSAVST